MRLQTQLWVQRLSGNALKPVLVDTGASILAYFVTEKSANTFPALPTGVQLFFTYVRQSKAH